MGRKRNNGLSEEKRNIIGQLIEAYDIKTAADIQEALKDLLGGTIQSMLEAELDQQTEEREEALSCRFHCRGEVNLHRRQSQSCRQSGKDRADVYRKGWRIRNT